MRVVLRFRSPRGVPGGYVGVSLASDLVFAVALVVLPMLRPRPPLIPVDATIVELSGPLPSPARGGATAVAAPAPAPPKAEPNVVKAEPKPAPSNRLKFVEKPDQKGTRKEPPKPAAAPEPPPAPAPAAGGAAGAPGPAGITALEGGTSRVASFLGFEDYPQSLPYIDETEPLNDNPLIQQVYSTHLPAVVIASVSEIPDWRSKPGLNWVGSCVAVPLIIGGEVEGIVNLYSEQEAAFDQESVERLISFTAPASVALHNAQLYQAETSARQVGETLSDAAQALTQTLNLEYVFDTLLDHIHRIVPSDTAGVTLLADETHLAVRALRGYGIWADQDDIPTFQTTGRTDSLIRRLNSDRRSLTIPNTPASQSGENQPDIEPIQIWLVVPIIASEQVIGMVEFGRVEPEPFSPEQIQWAEALVGQIAIPTTSLPTSSSSSTTQSARP